jgi:uncharacterized protein (TIGR03435 family)
MKTVSLIIWVTLATPGIHNVAAQTQAVPHLEFDVASIKPHPESAGSPRTSMSEEHGSIVYSNVTVRACIRKAYDLKVYPLANGPDEFSTARYDIVAKASGEPSKETTMRMLQALLTERFRLAVHRETKELPVYALIVGKGGPKFPKAKDDGSGAEIGTGGGHQFRAHHVSMTQLASALSGYIGEAVSDATELKGIFDLTLDFTTDENISAVAAAGPTIFEAVQQQLGLRLEARKGPVEVIVVDHVEKPTAN